MHHVRRIGGVVEKPEGASVEAEQNKRCLTKADRSSQDSDYANKGGGRSEGQRGNAEED